MDIALNSTHLIVTSRTIVSPSRPAKYTLCQLLQILNHLREPFDVTLTSISDKFNTLRGCGTTSLASAMRFSSAVGSYIMRGTVVGSMGPMQAERGSVARASRGCIDTNFLLRTRDLHQYVRQYTWRWMDMPTSRPSLRT
jgi:hypothetical protein